LKALLKREDLALHYSTMLETTPVSWFRYDSDVLFWVVHHVHHQRYGDRIEMKQTMGILLSSIKRLFFAFLCLLGDFTFYNFIAFPPWGAQPAQPASMAGGKRADPDLLLDPERCGGIGSHH